MNQRQSNIELLRIISMLLVLIVHATGATFGLPDIMTYHDLNSPLLLVKEAIESISIIGVNCFVLISGYFGIRFTIKGLVKLVLMCLFYSLFTLAVSCIFYPEKFTEENLITAIFIFPYNNLWFVPAYIWLYLCSPIINYFIAKASPTLRIIFSTTFILANIILGWWMDYSFNPTGYTAIQLIMVYIIGREIRLNNITQCGNTLLFSIQYTIFTIGIFASTFLFTSTKAFAYNSPLVLAASISFFLIFSTFRIKSRKINYIATSTFAVYLVHKSPFLWVHLRTLLYESFYNFSLPIFSIVAILGIMIIYILSIAIDKLTFSHLYSHIIHKI